MYRIKSYLFVTNRNNMIKKRETCLYCGEKIEGGTAKKIFCSDLHRVYWHREKVKLNKKENPKSVSIPENDDPEISILRQIIAIEREVIPKERNTAIGRATWQSEQNKRIQELKNKIK